MTSSQPKIFERRPARTARVSRRMTLWLACACLFAAALTAAPQSPAPEPLTRAAITVSASGDALLETGGVMKPATEAIQQTPIEIKIVSYNMRWRGGKDLRRLITLLREDAEIGGASVIGLQEVDRGKERTDHINTARLMAEELKMNYAWAAPPRADAKQKEDETGVAILSLYPLQDVTRLVLPHEGPNKRRRAGIGATVQLGKNQVRVYSVHAETRIPVAKKMDQLRATIEDLARYPQIERAIILGDFNTIKGKDVRAARQLFGAANFNTPFPDDRSTWHTFIIELKLDWLWLRVLQPQAHGITRRIELSDHWPLWVKVKV
ncbi:hypothetical protein BH18ACI2_BH18ACI2_28420 [soil metagenome]